MASFSSSLDRNLSFELVLRFFQEARPQTKSNYHLLVAIGALLISSKSPKRTSCNQPTDGLSGTTGSRLYPSLRLCHPFPLTPWSPGIKHQLPDSLLCAVQMNTCFLPPLPCGRCLAGIIRQVHPDTGDLQQCQRLKKDVFLKPCCPFKRMF